jgi:hypothetical protein
MPLFLVLFTVYIVSVLENLSMTWSSRLILNSTLLCTFFLSYLSFVYFLLRHCNCADIDRHLAWRKQNYLLVWMDGTILLQMCICGYMNAYASSDGLWPVCVCV